VKLDNRLPEEGINASREHPLKEFAWLLGGAAVVLTLAAFAISLGARWIAPRIPYEYEARLAKDFRIAPAPATDAARAVEAELQALANRLSARMRLPQGMTVKVHFLDSASVNAFATLGGQTVFFGGLLARLDSEDALAMVMAHEIAHLAYRHPAQALGRGVALGLVLSLVSAELGRSAAGGVLGRTGMVTVLAFNRDQERQADEEALRVLAAEYGHVGGALELFGVFSSLSGATGGIGAPQVEFLSTHPITGNRIESVRDWARANGKTVDGPRRPLPPAISALREAARAKAKEERR